MMNETIPIQDAGGMKMSTNWQAFSLKEPLPSDERGMSLRDYFAAKALQGMMAGATGLGTLQEGELRAMLDGATRLCWEAADSMIRTR